MITYMGDIRKTSHARYSLWYHLVWGTKYRKKIWKDKDTKNRVKEILRATALHHDIEIEEIEVLSDHVHMMASAPPRIAPSRIVQILKSISTKLLFEEFPWLKQYYWGGEIWVRGYFARSVGEGLTKAKIDRYIKEQSEER
ncbi:MAG: IS200/IS605 family transposase [Candidatus Pacebacteria bacterium]|nr:IS200/IS605 family transposase [Candidatus Paceibacterota bacterium]